MSTWCKGSGKLIPGQHTADRRTTGQRLGQGHDVRCNSKMFIGKQLAGPSHADLYLIKNQQQVVLIADPAHFKKIFR